MFRFGPLLLPCVVTFAAAVAVRSHFAATAATIQGASQQSAPPIGPSVYAQNIQRSPNSAPAIERKNANAIIESTNVPITFWGKVVDEDGAALDGAEIYYNYMTEHGNVAGAPWSDSKVHKAVASSNASGLFVIDGQHAHDREYP